MKRDLRQYSRQTSFRLVLGVLGIIFIIGNGLIAVFFGQQAAILSLLCMASALIPVGLVALALWVMDLISRQNTR